MRRDGSRTEIKPIARFKRPDRAMPGQTFKCGVFDYWLRAADTTGMTRCLDGIGVDIDVDDPPR
jgi:hypothetical protein